MAKKKTDAGVSAGRQGQVKPSKHEGTAYSIQYTVRKGVLKAEEGGRVCEVSPVQ